MLRKIITGAELLMFLKRSRRIRIIYIPERIQLHTEYCCLLWKSGNPEKGYTQPKRLNLNQSLKSRLAWRGRGSRKTEYVGCV